MNQNRRVVFFTLIIFLFLLSFSVLDLRNGGSPFSNINILSSITNEVAPQKALAPSIQKLDTLPPIERRHIAHVITNFGDTAISAMPRLQAKLLELKKGGKRKIRIAWFGDSMIEGDLVTQTIRQLLQNYFGGQEGVGFISIKSLSDLQRTTTYVKSDENWSKKGFADKSHEVYLSGQSYTSHYGELTIKDLSAKDTHQILEKRLICGPSDSTVDISVNNHRENIRRTNTHFESILLDQSKNKSIQIKWNKVQKSIYGISFEPEYGVIVDNFSYRGITGVELKMVEDDLLAALNQGTYYDLIVFQYGVNLMFRPKDQDYHYYEQLMGPVLSKFKQKMPNTDLLLVSCSDRAFLYNSEWKTAIGIDSLIKTQAQLALDHQMAFFNLYQSMGGEGTIVKWANSNPRWANKDYIHPNHQGAEVIGKIIADALILDFKKYERSTQIKKEP